MLVLSRKIGERILIGENITLRIVRIGPNNVRLGIDAPRGLNIVREEIANVERRSSELNVRSSTEEVPMKNTG